jgi:hypothetical protein
MSTRYGSSKVVLTSRQKAIANGALSRIAQHELNLEKLAIRLKKCLAKGKVRANETLLATAHFPFGGQADVRKRF